MVYVEPAFPRGKNTEIEDNGVAPRKKFKPNVNYGASTEEEIKVHKPRPKERRRALLEAKAEEREKQELACTASNLSIATVQPGMLVLGSVRRIFKMHLEMSLPGRLLGTVPISAISDAYTKRLEAMIEQKSMANCPTLEDLYTENDLVYVKVIEKECNQARLKLSLNPSDLHSTFTANQLVPGLVLIATIAVEEDHGYTMETGIRNVRAFLPKDGLRKNPSDIGRNLFCTIEKVTQQAGLAATIIVKAFRKKDNRVLNVAMANLDAIVPGCVVPFTVGSVVQHGLRGTLFDETVAAFANENMLTHTNSKADSYTLFQELQATVLYVMPVTRHVFVSLAKYANNRTEAEHAVFGPGATIQNAHVVKVTKSGVWLQFDRDYKALLPKNVIMKGIDGNYDETIVMAKYHVGSVHTLRILRYDAFDRTYVTSDTLDHAGDELSLGDVQIGKVYSVRVRQAQQSEGFLVEMGSVRGSVLRDWFDRTQHFKERKLITVRAVEFENDRPYVRFTNRPELVKKTAQILSSWEQITVGQQFHGVVVKEAKTYFLVKFFNNIMGMLPKKMREVDQDTAKLYTLRPGSVELFTVHETNASAKSLVLSLPGESITRASPLANATVVGVFPSGVDIKLDSEDVTGTIPLYCFSDFSSHNPLYLSLLKEGQQLSVVKLHQNTYSVRDVEYYHHNPMRMARVPQGAVLRASYFSRNGEPYASLLLNDYCEPIRLMVCEPEKKPEDIPEGEIIYAKVTFNPKGKNAVTYKLRANTHRNAVCPRGIEHVYEYTSAYMKDLACLIDRYKQAGQSFANYSVGQKVICTVDSVADNILMVEVRSCDKKLSTKTGTKGIAVKPFASQNCTYSKGETLDGLVIWVDVERQLVHVCVDSFLLQWIDTSNTRQPKFIAGSRTPCVKLFENEYVSICCRSNGSGPLIIVPVRHHYNDHLWYSIDRPLIAVFQLQTLGHMIFAVLRRSCVLYNSLDVIDRSAENTESHRSTMQRQKFVKESQQVDSNIGDYKDSINLRSKGTIRHAQELPETFDEPLLDDDLADKSDSSDLDETDGDESDDLYRDSVDDDDDEDYVYEEEKNDDDDDESEPKDEAGEMITKKLTHLYDAYVSVKKQQQKNGKVETGFHENDTKCKKIGNVRSKQMEKDTDSSPNAPRMSSKQKMPKTGQTLLGGDTTAVGDGLKLATKVSKKKKMFQLNEPQAIDLNDHQKVIKRKKPEGLLNKPPGKVEKKKKAPFSKDAAAGGAKLKPTIADATDAKILKTKKKKKTSGTSANLLIPQLDGTDDFLFSQLDGPKNLTKSTGPKTATKRKHGNDGGPRTKDSGTLPGTTNFWDSTPIYKRTVADSSSGEGSDEEEEARKVKTSKRLSAKERFEVMKQEEERLRKIEEELANPSLDPHTPDQFDRLVLAQPNNSMIWIRYMVHHMESAELDKARAVARKALKAINFREEAELLNVWIALLNLEIRYETVESFKEVLQEAIQYNDAFKVYSRVLDILIDCQKVSEVRELLELLLKKFRKQPEMWSLVADAWYRIDQGNKVKPLLSQATKSLPCRDHIPLIVKFAFLHNRYGNRDEAHLLFEQILTSYPKRTDIWSQYVDMLVKDGLVDNARQILERAIVQRLPMKNMKTLYTKFVNFEQKHGNRDSVRRVKQIAADYVQAQLNNAGVTTSDKGKK
ncbi:protein RRP5 homolog [Anopheles bellator]|uniref:protein RRP5 homolog n=1 Tax=Anopheles bellator TaxID=139047 RepID=UPI002647757D|nr:protein RRP5 homolog [Anopheles bellator]